MLKRTPENETVAASDLNAREKRELVLAILLLLALFSGLAYAAWSLP